MRPPVRATAAALVALFALVASACGGDSSTETGAVVPPPDAADNTSDADTHDAAPTDDAAAVAEDNIDALATSDDVRLLEILDVETGEATTLADTVTGDRPVLLWFWAPH